MVEDSRRPVSHLCRDGFNGNTLKSSLENGCNNCHHFFINLSGSSQMSQLFASGGQSIGVSCVWKPRVFPDDARECQCPSVLFLHSQVCQIGRAHV